MVALNTDREIQSVQIECGGAALDYIKGDAGEKGDFSAEAAGIRFTEEGTLSLTLQPEAIFFARILQNKEPGLYQGNLRVSGKYSGLFSLYGVEYAACYVENEMVSFSNSETIYVPAGCTVKTFRWDGMQPIQ